MQSGSMTEQASLPPILLEIVKALEKYLENLFPNRESTLPVKQRDRGINSILTWNIYPRSPEEVTDIFDNI